KNTSAPTPPASAASTRSGLPAGSVSIRPTCAPGFVVTWSCSASGSTPTQTSVPRAIHPRRSAQLMPRFRSGSCPRTRRDKSPESCTTCCVSDEERKSGRQDSNLRPRGPKPRALAKLSYAPSRYVVRQVRPVVNLTPDLTPPAKAPEIVAVLLDFADERVVYDQDDASARRGV